MTALPDDLKRELERALPCSCEGCLSRTSADHCVHCNAAYRAAVTPILEREAERGAAVSADLERARERLAAAERVAHAEMKRANDTEEQFVNCRAKLAVAQDAARLARSDAQIAQLNVATVQDKLTAAETKLKNMEDLWGFELHEDGSMTAKAIGKTLKVIGDKAIQEHVAQLEAKLAAAEALLARRPHLKPYSYYTDEVISTDACFPDQCARLGGACAK